MRALFFAVMMLAALPSAFADAPAARDLLHQCSEKAPESAVGFDQLEAACPGMHAALTELGFAGQLCDDCESVFDATALSDLVALHDRYAAEAGVAPDPTTVSAVLAQLRADQTDQQLSQWQRTKEWLRQWLGGKSRKVPPWFERWVEHLTVSELVVQILLYVLIAIVIALAIAVVIIELRAAGVLTGRSHSTKLVAAGIGATATPVALTLAQVESAAALEQPGMMLRLVIAVLVSNRQLAVERNLTHRELTRRVPLADAPDGSSPDRTRFANLARLAESIRYGRTGVDPSSTAHLQSVMSGAYDLYAQLQRRASTSTRQAVADT